jgi:hypothetical protein
MELTITCVFFATKDGFISYTITINNVFFFTVLETTEIITLKISGHIFQCVGL